MAPSTPGVRDRGVARDRATRQPGSEAPDRHQPALVTLLGESRATITRALKRDGEHSAPELAELLDISDVAVRRHLAKLAEAELITERTVKQERGRPVALYRLTRRGERLFPHRYVQVVDELIDFLDAEECQTGLGEFLRWRRDRQARSYTETVDGDDLSERLHQLSRALEGAGYEAEVRETEDGFELTQTHCAVYEVARKHPEFCANEAATFRQVLGEDVQVSRDQTLADGDTKCVCTVTTRRADGQEHDRQEGQPGPTCCQ